MEPKLLSCLEAAIFNTVQYRNGKVTNEKSDVNLGNVIQRIGLEKREAR